MVLPARREMLKELTLSVTRLVAGHFKTTEDLLDSKESPRAESLVAAEV
jgi:hypothetical protein